MSNTSYRVEAVETAEVEHCESLTLALLRAATLARRTKGDVRVYTPTGELLHLVKSSDILHLIGDDEINEAVRQLPNPGASTDESRAVITSSSIGRIRIVFKRYRDADGKLVWIAARAEWVGRQRGS